MESQWSPTPPEPLLCGSTAPSVINGVAVFKLRVTALSSHHDKRNFCLRISPRDSSVASMEPGMTVLTDPFKVVTKLNHTSPFAAAAAPPKREHVASQLVAVPPHVGNKRTAEEMLLHQGEQIRILHQTNITLFHSLDQLRQQMSEALRRIHSLAGDGANSTST